MIIALNIVMAGLVVVGIFTLLARSIVADRERIAKLTAAAIPAPAHVTARPPLGHDARTRSRSGAGSRTVRSH